MTDSTGRAVVDIETESNSDGSLFVTAAVYGDTFDRVPDDELDWISDAYPEWLDERRLDRLIGIAEAHWEGDR